MLVDTKARVGVFAIALGAYLPQFPSLVPEFQAQYAKFKTFLDKISFDHGDRSAALIDELTGKIKAV